MVVFLYNQKQE